MAFLPRLPQPLQLVFIAEHCTFHNFVATSTFFPRICDKVEFLSQNLFNRKMGFQLVAISFYSSLFNRIAKGQEAPSNEPSKTQNEETLRLTNCDTVARCTSKFATLRDILLGGPWRLSMPYATKARDLDTDLCSKLPTTVPRVPKES